MRERARVRESAPVFGVNPVWEREPVLGVNPVRERERGGGEERSFADVWRTRTTINRPLSTPPP